MAAKWLGLPFKICIFNTSKILYAHLKNHLCWWLCFHYDAMCTIAPKTFCRLNILSKHEIVWNWNLKHFRIVLPLEMLYEIQGNFGISRWFSKLCLFYFSCHDYFANWKRYLIWFLDLAFDIKVAIWFMQVELTKKSCSLWFYIESISHQLDLPNETYDLLLQSDYLNQNSSLQV